MTDFNFINRQQELFDLFAKNKFDDAHSLLTVIEIEFPERLDKISFWRACIFATQGLCEQAVKALQTALDKGVWWNPQTLSRDSDLKPLQEVPEFKKIIENCKEILEKKINISQTDLRVFGNRNADSGVFSLHWRGSNVNDFAPYWLDGVLLDKYLFGFPQSSQIYGYNAYSWDNDRIALKDITNSFHQFESDNQLEKTIIAGASQGGKLAIELSLKDTLLRTNGFIAVIPAIKDVSLIEETLKNKKFAAKIKGCIITGDKDPFYENTIELNKLLEKYEVRCKLFVKKGLGHFFPDDFTSILSEAINFINELD